jgi:hypothetical protein
MHKNPHAVAYCHKPWFQTWVKRNHKPFWPNRFNGFDIHQNEIPIPAGWLHTRKKTVS